MPALAGAGVLVTRPRHQAGELLAAVKAAGGDAIPFPVIDIAVRDPAAVATDLESLAEPDIAVFVSPNAVRHGLHAAPATCRIAAIGSATAAAITAAGRQTDIAPAVGYDSEALLAEPALQAVAGQTVRIVRGNGGRELLGDTLRQRGAQVHYLTVYERRRHRLAEHESEVLTAAWTERRIHYVIAMSVASFEHLMALLPGEMRAGLSAVRLVTPTDRVIKTALERAPRMRTLLAGSPRTEDLVAAMIADWRTQTEHRND